MHLGDIPKCSFSSQARPNSAHTYSRAFFSSPEQPPGFPLNAISTGNDSSTPAPRSPNPPASTTLQPTAKQAAMHPRTQSWISRRRRQQAAVRARFLYLRMRAQIPASRLCTKSCSFGCSCCFCRALLPRNCTSLLR